MAFGDEIYSDESVDQRLKRLNELSARAGKVVQEALAKAQRAQDARDRLLEANAVMLSELCYRVGAMSGSAVQAQRDAKQAIWDLRENTGRNEQGVRE